MTPLCQVCSHRHTTDLTSLSPSGCADHAWSDACPYQRPGLDVQPGASQSPGDLFAFGGRWTACADIKLTPGQWAVIQAANPPLADRPINPLYRPLGDLLGITVVMVADESECTPVVEGWLKPKPAPYPRRWWQRLWRWR